jgi:hypothetical protein
MPTASSDLVGNLGSGRVVKLASGKWAGGQAGEWDNRPVVAVSRSTTGRLVRQLDDSFDDLTKGEDR